MTLAFSRHTQKRNLDSDNQRFQRYDGLDNTLDDSHSALQRDSHSARGANKVSAYSAIVVALSAHKVFMVVDAREADAGSLDGDSRGPWGGHWW